MKALSVPHRKAAALGELWVVCLYQTPYLAKHTWIQEVQQITELDNVFMGMSFNTLDSNW